MKKRLIVVLALVVCTNVLATERTPQPVPERVYFSGMSDELATDALLVSLINKNYLAKKVGPNKVGVQLGNHQFVLQPSLNPEGIDRILASRFYAVSPKLVGSQELVALIGTLNDKLNFAKFTLREEGKVIQVQGAATFVGTLELEELRRFLIWTDDALMRVGQALPNSAEQLIKPIPVMSAN
ncbi:hypothetical protein [Shewanella sp. Isolate7]|uniref:hypothetical protein n=1 Tax=Shewanella sp. Isolate7 TaxID=2908528 RepID=UPI001EFE4431|nr:hypothetical protein [Shewanella sp. Isolate7]MCG9720118.1 hypothetical protein [Shewanella sp. Isolate7]